MKAVWEIGQYVMYEGWWSLGMFTTRKKAVQYLHAQLGHDRVSLCDSKWTLIRHGGSERPVGKYDEISDNTKMSSTPVAKLSVDGEWSDCGNHFKVMSVTEEAV